MLNLAKKICLVALLGLTAPVTHAEIFDYQSMHVRLAAVLGSRAKADEVYSKLSKKAIDTRQPIELLVDIFIALCTASDECSGGY
jgi:hypothetical protein